MVVIATPPTAMRRWNSMRRSVTRLPWLMPSNVAALMTRLDSSTGPSRAGPNGSRPGWSAGVCMALADAALVDLVPGAAARRLAAGAGQQADLDDHVRRRRRLAERVLRRRVDAPAAVESVDALAARPALGVRCGDGHPDPLAVLARVVHDPDHLAAAGRPGPRAVDLDALVTPETPLVRRGARERGLGRDRQDGGDDEGGASEGSGNGSHIAAH